MDDHTYASLAKFSTLLMQRLHDNQDKGDWSAWNPGRLLLIKAIEDNFNKLVSAILSGDPALVREESGDLANLCLKAAERFGNL